MHEKKGYIFKIVDHIGEHKKYKKLDLSDPLAESKISQRTMKRGQECTNYSLDQLTGIMESLGMTSRGSKDSLCRLIELQLRKLDDVRTTDVRATKVRTFYRPWEVHPMTPQTKTEKPTRKRKSKT